jgi:hypothetical protein
MSLESKIDELIAALDRNTAAQGGAVAEEQSEPAKRGRKPKNSTESTPPAGATTAPAATAPAASVTTPTQPAASATPAANPQLLTETTAAIVDLANQYDRDGAIAILGKARGPNGSRPGVRRCSDLNPLDLQDVLNEAKAAIAAAEAAKAAAASGSLV